MTARRANSIAIYGATGSYKTTQVGRFARFVYEQTGKRTRLLSADGGGWLPAQAEVDAGLIEALSLVEARNILPTMRHLMRGEWISRDQTNNKLVWTTDGLASVGAYAIEGLTSLSTQVLRDIAAKQRKISEDVVGAFEEEGEKFAAPARAHYNFVQNFIMDLIIGFGALPVSWILWTGHEGRGEDPFTKTSVYGPASVGKAATDKIPPMLGDLLHFEQVTIKAKDKPDRQETRAYYRNHPDSQNPLIQWPSKVRIPPEKVVELENKWPGGYLELTLQQGLDDFLRLQDSLLTAASSSIEQWKARIDTLENFISYLDNS